MSGPAKPHPWEGLTARELRQWPGVAATWERRAKHRALILTFDGRKRTVIVSNTPGDGNAHHAHVSTVRSELANLGAKRAIPLRRSRTRPPHRTVVSFPRPAKITREPARYGRSPARDPFVGLAGFEVRQPTPEPPPPAPVPFGLTGWLAVAIVLGFAAAALVAALAATGRITP